MSSPTQSHSIFDQDFLNCLEDESALLSTWEWSFDTSIVDKYYGFIDDDESSKSYSEVPFSMLPYSIIP